MYHIIINPIAGRGRTIHRLPILTKLFDSHGLTYEAHITTGLMDGYEKAKRFCESGKDCKGIIGIGGDGTFQEIAAGMVDSYPHGQKIPIPLGIFPAGSGNDFIMTLEGGKSIALAKYKKDIEMAAKNFFETLHRGKTRSIDVITANGMAFLNIGNLGLDARIVDNAAALKPKYGRQAYVAAVYKSIAKHKNIPLTIEANGEKWDKQYTLVAICNGQYYGGGLHITPGAKIDDGKITLCLIEAMSRPKTMVLFPTLMMGQHVKLKPVKFIECENLVITLPPGKETLCLDGNLYPDCNVEHPQPEKKSDRKTDRIRLEFKILPRVLDVFV